MGVGAGAPAARRTPPAAWHCAGRGGKKSVSARTPACQGETAVSAHFDQRLSLLEKLHNRWVLGAREVRKSRVINQVGPSTHWSMLDLNCLDPFTPCDWCLVTGVGIQEEGTLRNAV